MSEARGTDFAFSEAHYDMFPELRYFVNGEAPIEDLQIYLRFQSGWPTVAVVVFSVVSAYPVFHLFDSVLGFSRGYAVGGVIVVNLFVSWLLLSLICPKIQQRQIRAALRARLLDLGIPTCRNCAYDMRGSPESCPECGMLA